MTPTLDLALTVAHLGLAALRLDRKAPPLADPDPTDPTRREEPAPGAQPLPNGRPIAERLKEFFRQQEREILAKVPKVETAPIPEDLSVTDWTDRMTSAMTPIITPYWEESGQRTMAGLGLDPGSFEVVSPYLRRKIDELTLAFCDATNRTTTDQLDRALGDLRSSLAEGLVDRGETLVQLRKRVQAVFTEASDSRAHRIAATEASRAVNTASLEAAKQSGVVGGKILVISSDACPLCLRVKASEPPGGWPLDDAMYDDGKGHAVYSVAPCPPLHPHCSCTISYTINSEALAEGPTLPDGVTPEDLVGRDESTAEIFTPAATVEEAGAWARSRGIVPNWTAEGYEDHNYRLTLDDINEVHGAIDPLIRQYPEAKPASVGSFYARDLAKWNGNFARNVEEDRREYERAGKRWRESEARKRVIRKMIDRPTPDQDGTQKYSVFIVGTYNDRDRDLAVTHKKVVVQTRAKSDERRAADLAKGRQLAGVDESIGGTAEHEYAHGIHYTYGIHLHPKMVALHGSFTADQIKAGISQYATTNLNEFIAEGFTEGLRPDARPMGRQVKALVDEIVAEYRRKKR